MAIVKVDPSRPAREQFLEMAARVSLTRHPDANVTLGMPSRVNDADPADTMIVFNTQSKHTRRQRVVRYRRADLHKAYMFQMLKLEVDADATEAQIIQAINSLGFTQIVPGEVTISAPVATADPNWLSITITAKPESLLYVEEFTVYIQGGEVHPVGARIKMVLMTYDDHYLIRTDGQRQTLFSVDGLLDYSGDLNGQQLLSGNGARFDHVLYLVDDAGRPLPEAEQPESFDYDFAGYTNVMANSKTEVAAAIQMYIDSGMAIPAWYVPGCSFVSAGIGQRTPQNAAPRIALAERPDVPAVSYRWRLPRYTASARMSELKTRNAFYRLPESVAAEGLVRYTFPNYNEPEPPSSGGYYVEHGILDPTTGLSGGLLHVVDSCDAWNNPTSGGDAFTFTLAGQVDLCEDIPEWVGTPFGATGGYYNTTYQCRMPDKVADPGTVAVLPPVSDSPNVSVELAFPGSSRSMYASVSWRPAWIDGLQFILHKASELPYLNS